MRRFFSSHSDSLFSIFTHRLYSRWVRRKRRLLALRYACAAFCIGVLGARATSVVPPSFPELVAEAQVIARGTVTSVEARRVEGTNRPLIKTFVTFAVEERIKGNPADTLTLEFLGGTVGGDTLHVSGMPEFKVGESEILFVNGNGVQFCPLVRFMHGRYHVRTDNTAHRKFVARDDARPLHSVTDVQLPADDHDSTKAYAHSSADAMTPEQFETEIKAEIARHAR